MEVLLLDTTEKEGEDNTLYHYVHSSPGVGCFSTSSPGSRPDTTRWLDLRGVLAAAVGATTSLCGEPLRFARFGNDDTNGFSGIVGFVNIYEVLYALVFSSTDLPTSIVQVQTDIVRLVLRTRLTSPYCDAAVVLHALKLRPAPELLWLPRCKAQAVASSRRMFYQLCCAHCTARRYVQRHHVRNSARCVFCWSGKLSGCFVLSLTCDACSQT